MSNMIVQQDAAICNLLASGWQLRLRAPCEEKRAKSNAKTKNKVLHACTGGHSARRGSNIEYLVSSESQPYS